MIAAIVGIIITTLVGRLAGQDYNWDLLNYHYASSYLLLDGDYLRNVAPSGMQSWFNPIGYVPAFLAIRDLPPWLASAILAGVAGLNAPLIFSLAAEVGRELPRPARTRAAFICVVVGMTGAITLSEAGTTFLDVTLSLLILGALLTIMRAARQGRVRGHALGGGLLGLACGLKLTSAVLAIGMAATFAILITIRRLRPAALPALAAGGLVGFALTGGWWAWWLWRTFDNPVFPLLNGIFQSPFGPQASLLDTGFIPRHWTGIATYPWHWLIGTEALGAEIPIRDPRFAIALVACLATFILAIARRRMKPRNDAALLVTCFFTFSYLIWLFAFAILRYVVVLEMISGIVMLAALCSLPTLVPERLWQAMAIVALAILLATRPAAWGRVPFTDDWFGVRGVQQVHRPGTLYVMTGDAPLGFLLPLFPEDARFVRIGGRLDLSPQWGLGVKVADMIRTTPRLRSLAAASDTAMDGRSLGRFDLVVVPGTCRIITTKAADVESCELRARP